MRAESLRKARDLYGVIVTQARQQEFYADLGIPDTAAGHYEMIVVHLFVVLERLRSEPKAHGTLAQLLIESFVSDMDDSLREMGAGDMSVPKKVRRAAAGLYERSGVYREALAAGDRSALARPLARYVYDHEDSDWRSEALAGYVGKAMAGLLEQDGIQVVAGRIAFPAVGAIGKDVR